MDWGPVISFYIKTTSWIIIPLIFAIFLSKYFSDTKLFLLVIVAFGITCFGIYKEIKDYKRNLNKNKDGNK